MCTNHFLFNHDKITHMHRDPDLQWLPKRVKGQTDSTKSLKQGDSTNNLGKKDSTAYLTVGVEEIDNVGLPFLPPAKNNAKFDCIVSPIKCVPYACTVKFKGSPAHVGRSRTRPTISFDLQYITKIFHEVMVMVYKS
jgi:hypothetical protein